MSMVVHDHHEHDHHGVLMAGSERTIQLGGPGQAAALEGLRKAGERDIERVAHGVDEARARQRHADVRHVVRVAQHLVHDVRRISALHHTATCGIQSASHSVECGRRDGKCSTFACGVAPNCSRGPSAISKTMLLLPGTPQWTRQPTEYARGHQIFKSWLGVTPWQWEHNG